MAFTTFQHTNSAKDYINNTDSSGSNELWNQTFFTSNFLSSSTSTYPCCMSSFVKLAASSPSSCKYIQSCRVRWHYIFMCKLSLAKTSQFTSNSFWLTKEFLSFYKILLTTAGIFLGDCYITWMISWGLFCLKDSCDHCAQHTAEKLLHHNLTIKRHFH